jgi:hypothetical protein
MLKQMQNLFDWNLFIKGFYTVYHQLFKDIAEQDYKASSDKKIEIPDFGNSESDYEEVRKDKKRFVKSYFNVRDRWSILCILVKLLYIKIICLEGRTWYAW